jgi:adenylate cyclase
MDDANRRLAGILAADVVGYSAMVGKDEPATLARVRTLRADLIEPLAAAYGGRLFKTTGDGFLAAFASAVQALRCAIAIQERLNSEPDGLRLRIGVHQGEVVAEGDDLLGDGVIIAARLEPLAEAGGICISARVREDAAGKMALEVDDLGTPELKNIVAKVQVFRVRLGTAERPALPLPDKPSLVVLPFQNMSGDPEQEYFADGMVEEITTALSRIRSLFVIARNSAFTYKGRAVDVRQVGRELGVRYVLEGSVRKAGSRVRITGQLVEAATSAHLWADRFEGTLEDVFDLQDRMTASVVAAIEPNVRAAEIQRAQRKPAANLQAYDLLLRALPHLYGRTRAGSAEGVRLLQQAVAIDPSYALGLAYLAECHYRAMTRGLIDPDDPMVAELVPLVQSALALDPNDPEVLAIAGDITAPIGGDLSGGMALLDRSLELNPNNAHALAAAAFLRANSGDTGAAISLLDRSARHNPLDWNYRLCSSYTFTYLVAGEYERAVEWSAKALQEFPHSTVALRYRAACLGQLGRLEEGCEVVQHLLAVLPDFTVTRYRRFLVCLNKALTPSTIDALCEGLRRCGAPE